MVQRKINKIILTLLVSILAALFIAPLLWMISSSFKQSIAVFEQPFHWIPQQPTISNYIKVWFGEQISMLRSYWNTFFVVVVSVTGSLILASLAAYSFAKINFKGKNFMFMIFLSSIMIPGQATLIPRFMLFKSIGLYNNLWSLILPGLFNATSIFMLRQVYLGLPTDLIDAAKIDGAGHLRIFSTIMMPLTKPALTSLLILSCISIWNEYLSALIFLTKDKLYTVSLCIRWWMLSESGSEYGPAMAAATSAIIPIIILFFVCQKYFIEGIATSGLKG